METVFEMTPQELQRLEDLDVRIKMLPTLDRVVLICRFGLFGEKPRTLEKTARLLLVNRERLRQIQNIALKRLADLMKSDSEDPAQQDDGEAKRLAKQTVRFYKSMAARTKRRKDLAERKRWHNDWCNETIKALQAFKCGAPIQMRGSVTGHTWCDFDLASQLDMDGMVGWRVKPEAKRGNNGNTIS